MIGKPYSGKLNVRFDEGELEIGLLSLRQFSTLPFSFPIVRPKLAELEVIYPENGAEVANLFTDVKVSVRAVEDKSIYTIVKTPQGTMWTQEKLFTEKFKDELPSKAQLGEGAVGVDEAFKIFAIATKEELKIGVLPALPEKYIASNFVVVRRVEPLVYDFEGDIQGWGEHPENEVLTPGQGVSTYCDRQTPIKHAGNCSLKFVPSRIRNNNAYVTVRKNAQGSNITAYVFVLRGAETCTHQACSTVKIIVWDRNGRSYESDYVELIPGSWPSISWNLREMPLARSVERVWPSFLPPL